MYFGNEKGKVTMIKEFDFDVVVLGAGGAGCTAAIVAARNGASVALVSKEAIGMGNTRICEGVMTSSGVLDGDSPEILKEDMLKGGEYLNNLELVEIITKNASSAIRFVESLGHFFRRDEEGMLSPKTVDRLGGHSFHRSFVSPGSGVSLAHALRNAVCNTNSISVFEDTMVISLLQEEEEVYGVLAVGLKKSDCLVLRGKVSILATGGCGWLYYPQTTNNISATGDGYAVAFEAGAELIDMEMVQFHPFAMNHPIHYAGTLLAEPVLAGPKGKLINGLGEAVADRDINRMTRAKVTALMAKEIAAGRVTKWGGLKLDLSGNLDVPEMVHFKKVNDERKRFEKVHKAYGEAAFNWEAPWDVSPSAHYMMGGVRIDRNGHSSLKNLYAVGEVAGGVMGANRLGSTSLTDIFVMGMVVGEEAARSAVESRSKEIKKSLINKEVEKIESLFGKKGTNRPIKIERELQKIMRENGGIVRDEPRLNYALNKIESMQEQMEHDVSISTIRRYNSELIDLTELKNMLILAKIIVICARMRTESRGAHLRLDYPDKDDANWLKNIIVFKEDGEHKTSISEINAGEIRGEVKTG